MKLPQMNDYVIPFRLTAAGTEVNEELNTILVNPRMQQTEVLVRNAGLVESDLSAADANTLEFVTYTEFNNKWDTESTYDHGGDVLAEYNAANAPCTASQPTPIRRARRSRHFSTRCAC